MAEFVYAMPVSRHEIALQPWQLDVVVRRRIDGLVIDNPQVRAAGADQCHDLRHEQPFRNRWRHGEEIIGRPSHCAALKTVNRLRNGMATASSSVSREWRRSS
jgi:hypothetical protein